MNSLSQSVQSGSATWRLLMNRGEGVALDTLALTAVSCTRIKGARSYLAGMAVAIPILNVDGRRHTNNFSKYI